MLCTAYGLWDTISVLSHIGKSFSKIRHSTSFSVVSVGLYLHLHKLVLILVFRCFCMINIRVSCIYVFLNQMDMVVMYVSFLGGRNAKALQQTIRTEQNENSAKHSQILFFPFLYRLRNTAHLFKTRLRRNEVPSRVSPSSLVICRFKNAE